MNLNELKKNWEALGKTRPFWAILSTKSDWDLDEFFKLGEADITALMNDINSLNRTIRRRKALDFGCGVGRLTQALCRHFDQCYGVDIAPSMLELAAKYNRYGDKCRYFLNQSEHLRLFENDSFDLVYSTLVLQHMRPEYSKNYIKEFVRILAPGGLIIFHLPYQFVDQRYPSGANSGARLWHKALVALNEWKAKLQLKPLTAKIEMYYVPKQEIIAWVSHHGGTIVDVRESTAGGEQWPSFCYFVTK